MGHNGGAERGSHVRIAVVACQRRSAETATQTAAQNAAVCAGRRGSGGRIDGGRGGGSGGGDGIGGRRVSVRQRDAMGAQSVAGCQRDD